MIQSLNLTSVRYSFKIHCFDILNDIRLSVIVLQIYDKQIETVRTYSKVTCIEGNYCSRSKTLKKGADKIRANATFTTKSNVNFICKGQSDPVNYRCELEQSL